MEIVFIGLSLTIWLFLLLFWGDFWRANRRLDEVNTSMTVVEPNTMNSSSLNALSEYPTVWAIVPARDEAEVISTSLMSLLNQDYLGEFSIVVVDDNSSDRTREIALATAEKLNKTEQLKAIEGKPLADGWKGKLWAVQQGITDVKSIHTPDYFLFTDADIKHPTDNISRLVAKARTQQLDLVSLMVLLRCQSFWEKLLIPAFVFFFQKLYPFAWVNNPERPMAAAAGGCILISDRALTAIGGIATIKDALIDDCSLAQAVKSQGKNIWLGLSETTTSLRGYDNLKIIWNTVARTAYTQLNYSPLLLMGTVIGMVILYLVTPICLTIGVLTGNWLALAMSISTWLLMTWAYLPTIKLYNLSIVWAFSLPAIALLYTLMTLDSAVKYYQGKGGAWKGRTY